MSIKIAFCGIDGAGKSTQLNRINGWLAEEGYSAKITKVQFRDLEIIYELSNKLHNNPYAYGLLPPDIVRSGIAFDVVHHYMHLDEETDFILCDRHKLCFLAYGIAYGTYSMDVINNIFNLIDDPQMIVYFDVDTNISNSRLCKRSGKKIRFDEQEEHLKEVKRAYESLIKNQKEVFRVDANQKEEVIFSIIKQEIRRRFIGS